MIWWYFHYWEISINFSVIWLEHFFNFSSSAIRQFVKTKTMKLKNIFWNVFDSKQQTLPPHESEKLYCFHIENKFHAIAQHNNLTRTRATRTVHNMLHALLAWRMKQEEAKPSHKIYTIPHCFKIICAAAVHYSLLLFVVVSDISTW